MIMISEEEMKNELEEIGHKNFSGGMGLPEYGVSKLTESSSYNFEYEKINTIFEMTFSVDVKWNYEPKTSKVSKSDCLVDDEVIQYNCK